MEVTGYAYTVLHSEQREALVHHWHPVNSSLLSCPHMDLGEVAFIGRPQVHNSQIPTCSPISVGVFLRFLIKDLSVEPLRTDLRFHSR